MKHGAPVRTPHQAVKFDLERIIITGVKKDAAEEIENQDNENFSNFKIFKYIFYIWLVM